MKQQSAGSEEEGNPLHWIQVELIDFSVLGAKMGVIPTALVLTEMKRLSDTTLH